MIRLIQRRLIVPRGDTGTFSIPVLAGKDTGDVSIFTIFDPLMHRKIFEKVMTISGETLTMELTHGDTVNLPVGQYVWDIKFYTDPIFAEEKLIGGTEVDSYYAAFTLPVCEIRETGDNLLMSDDAPTGALKPGQIDFVTASINEMTSLKNTTTIRAAEADTSAQNAAASAQDALDSKVAALAAEQTATSAAQSAQASATLAAEKADQMAADLENKADKSEIPTKVSDLVDDSGHYVKPANGIPASDLEETYLTEHQDLSNYVQKTDYASSANAGVVITAAGYGTTMSGNGIISVSPATSKQIKAGTMDFKPIIPKTQHEAAFYGLAKAAGSDEKDSTLPIGQYTDTAKAAIQQMLGVPSTADIPMNVSELTNDAGYLTQHQDISGKANIADLATVATSGSYEDLNDKPTIPDIQIDGTSIVDNGVANISYATKSVGGVVKVDGAGLAMGVTGVIGLTPATSSMIKAGTESHRIIGPKRQHESVFYGLSKAAGADLANEENITVGTYPAAAKTAIQTMLDVPSNAAMTTAIGNAIGNINSFDMAVVQALPSQDISTHTIYLVPKTGETNDVYDEYVYINDGWEMIGNTQIDLSNYATIPDMNKRAPAIYTIGASPIINAVPNMPFKSLILTIVGDPTDVGTSNANVTVGPSTTAAEGTTYTKSFDPIYEGTLDFVSGKLTITKAILDLGSIGYNYNDTYHYFYSQALYGIIDTDDPIYSSDMTVHTVEEIQSGEEGVAFGGATYIYVYNDNYIGMTIDEFKAAVAGKYIAYTLRTPQVVELGTTEIRALEGTTYVMSDDGTISVEYQVDTKEYIDLKADKANPVFTGSISLGRKENTTIGNGSTAIGLNNEASGAYSHAEGSGTTATGHSAHVEGSATTASGTCSHAEGLSTRASGYGSHTEGVSTMASGTSSHAENSASKAYGHASHAEGVQTIANGIAQHTGGMYNVSDTSAGSEIERGTYIEIIGNGTADNARSNARALDWNGNEHLMGNIYVGANADSTGGTKVATVAELAAKLDAAEAGLKVVRLI